MLSHSYAILLCREPCLTMVCAAHGKKQRGAGDVQSISTHNGKTTNVAWCTILIYWGNSTWNIGFTFKDFYWRNFLYYILENDATRRLKSVQDHKPELFQTVNIYVVNDYEEYVSELLLMFLNNKFCL